MNGRVRPVAVIAGAGPGLGAALARRFAEEYAVAIIARRKDYLRSLAAEIEAAGGQALVVPGDVGDAAQVEAAYERICRHLGSPQILLYNAGSSTWGTISEITPGQFEQAWRVNALGAFLHARAVVPDMVRRGTGAILLTGATAGVKAAAKSIAFGPAKFAARGLAQALARDLGPKGVHVAWINIDGFINVPGGAEIVPGTPEEELLDPGAIAETCWHLAHQDRSAWTLELDIRPFKERF